MVEMMMILILIMVEFARLCKKYYELLHLVENRSNYCHYYITFKGDETKFQKGQLCFPRITS